MSERQCGTCTACCEGWLKSKVVGMFPGHACKFLTKQGCGIYATRPHHPCRTFVCGWLQKDSPLPEEMRPDRAGVIVIMGQKWQKWDAIRAVATGPRIPPASFSWLKNYALQSKTPMLFLEYLHSGDKVIGESMQGFGPPEFSKAVQESRQVKNEM